MGILKNSLTSFFNLINSAVYPLVNNLGIAYFLDIVIFTAIIKLILLPLTISQTRSTVKMSEMQPKLKALQEKYKNDPQKLQQVQMELYKESGVNPLAGCLPLIIQMPIFIAMYYVLYNYQGFADVPFYNMVGSIGNPVTWVLPVLSGATTYIQGIMMAPKGEDQSAKTQKQMNIFMSIFLTYMSFQFKYSLVIYWIISNVIQILIQYFIINRIKHHEEAKLVK